MPKNRKYPQGTVILVPFPFTDLSGTKVRPAVVISHNLQGNDLIAVFLSSKRQQKLPQHAVKISKDTQNNLKVDSVAICSKIATLEKNITVGKLGNLSSKDLKAVLQVVRGVLNI